MDKTGIYLCLDNLKMSVIKLFSVRIECLHAFILFRKRTSNSPVPYGGFNVLDLLKRKNKVVGIKQTKKALEQGQLDAVFIACDAESRVVMQIKLLCDQKAVRVYDTESMKQLGKAAGIDVGASVVGIGKL